jgi:hypothetical protein
VAQHVQRRGVAIGEHFERSAGPERRDQILDLAVQLHGNGGHQQALANGLHDL